MFGDALSSRAAVRPKAAPSRPLATNRYRKLNVIRIAVRTVRLGSSPSSCTHPAAALMTNILYGFQHRLGACDDSLCLPRIPILSVTIAAALMLTNPCHTAGSLPKKGVMQEGCYVCHCLMFVHLCFCCSCGSKTTPSRYGTVCLLCEYCCALCHAYWTSVAFTQPCFRLHSLCPKEACEPIIRWCDLNQHAGRVAA